jgi:hypothetical protein
MPTTKECERNAELCLELASETRKSMRKSRFLSGGKSTALVPTTWKLVPLVN